MALAAAVLALAACAAQSGAGGVSSKGGSDTPIRLMVDETETPAAALGGLAFPYSGYGAKAAAAAINEKGGINGHPVLIDVCDNQGSPDQSATCGREARQNGDIAVVGSEDIVGAAAILPVLQAESIPYIGADATSAVELSNPMTFTFDPAADFAVAVGSLWEQQDCRHVVLLSPNAGPGGELVSAMQAFAQKKHIPFTLVPISITLVDASAPVATVISDHPDCVTVAGAGQSVVKLIAGLRQAGYTGKIMTSAGTLLPSLLPALGSLGNGVLVTSTVLLPNSKDPLVTEYRDDMTTLMGAKQAAQNLNEFSQDGWSSVDLVDQALTIAKADSSAALLKTLPKMCDVNVGNVYPDIDFCKPVLKSSVYPRLYNDEVRYYVAEGGQYAPLDNKWHNIGATVPTS
jgi:ABC-type branched-subunit amino acid transport system substrate-binding protein